ncbi:MAG: SAM-dependent methyltransferase, partial [Acidobacteriota bacterium]
MGNPSITALVTAFARGYHAAHGHPPIFDDRLAFQILTPEEQAFLSQSVAGMLAFVNPELAAAGLDQAVALDWVM